MEKENFPRKKYLLIGEMHGVRENMAVLKFFVNLYINSKIKFTIAFEWPSSLSKNLNEYIAGKTNTLSWKQWGFVQYHDGRISKEHIAFLSWLKKKNTSLPSSRKIKVLCFDGGESQWNIRDKQMAKNLMKTRTKVIAIMGWLHASKTKLYFGKQEHRPLGYYLPPDKTITIKINYSNGKFYNHKIKRLTSLKIKKLGLIKNEGLDFDYCYNVKEAHPIQLL